MAEASRHGKLIDVPQAVLQEFTHKTRAYGIEVFRDENTGVTLYTAETGSITAMPAKQALRCRRALGLAYR